MGIHFTNHTVPDNNLVCDLSRDMYFFHLKIGDSVLDRRKSGISKMRHDIRLSLLDRDQ